MALMKSKLRNTMTDNRLMALKLLSNRVMFSRQYVFFTFEDINHINTNSNSYFFLILGPMHRALPYGGGPCAWDVWHHGEYGPAGLCGLTI